MSAREQISMLLNELMGPSRNDDVDRSALNYKDVEVCKFFLASFCPHELFVNTKADIGLCQYYHDENLRIAYRNSRDFEKLGYERSFYRFLCKMHDDMMRKIQKNKERLALTQGNLTNVDEETKNRLNQKVLNMEKEITSHLQEAENAGANGDLEKSQKYVKKVEELRAEIDNAKKSIGPPVPFVRTNDPNAPKPMEVCETCGCFLIIGDVQQRIEEHFTGKQHLGFAKITTTMNELKERLRIIEDVEKSPNRRQRSRSTSRHRDRERSSYKNRENRKRYSYRDDNRHHHSSKRTKSQSHDRDRNSHHQHRQRKSRSRSRSHRHH